uniref:V-SNARE coiled-coil homology domain-containing protein n=1 Tax=Tetraselmis sp. GSL018 TaxID=582737 RepID=A0A061RJI2_9CHLO
MVYSLPRLSAVLAVQYCLGWPFAGGFTCRRAAPGPEGQLAVASRSGEMVRLALGGAYTLPGPESLYDIKTAVEGQARAAVRAAAARLELEAADADADDGSSREEGKPALLAGLEKFSGDLMKNLGMAAKTRKPTELRRRFNQHVAMRVRSPPQPQDDIDLRRDASIEVDDIGESGEDVSPPTKQPTNQPPPPPAPAKAEPPPKEERPSRHQSRAVGSAPLGGVPQRRTSAQIKELYGGGRQSKTSAAQGAASSASAVMGDNVARMRERGERLSKLQEKTAALEDNAKGFADMARELAKKQSSKKWWQL